MECVMQSHNLLQWAAAIESLESGYPGSDKSFGMQQRPDADIEIDAKFWEEEFEIPHCEQCGGLLKPDVCIFTLLELLSQFDVVLLDSFVMSYRIVMVMIVDITSSRVDY